MHSSQNILEQAIKEHKEGNLKKAEILYREIILKQPNNYDIYYLLGTNLVQQKSYKDGIFYLEKYHQHKPDHIENLNTLGIALLKNNQYKDGVLKFKDALEINPNNKNTLFNLGKACQENQDFVSAESYFTKLILQDPNNRKIINNYAVCLIKREKVIAAIDFLKEKIEQLEPNIDTYKILIENLIKQDNFHDALEYSSSGNKLWPDDNEILLYLATSNHKLKKVKEAKEKYLILVERKENNHSYLNKFANFLYEIGEWKEAEIYAIRSYKINPTSPNSLTNLGRIRQQRGDLEGAVKFYHKAIEMKPDYGDPYNNLGNIYLYMDKTNESIKYFNQAIKLKPRDLGIRFNRCLAQLTLGKIGSFWKEHKLRFRKTDPNKSREWKWKEWNGENIEGKNILLWGEQGLGDEIIHSRCINRISKISNKCFVEASPRLTKLFKRSFPLATIVDMKTPPLKKITDNYFDFHSSSLDINCSLYNSPKDINSQSYLKADNLKVETLRKKYIEKSGGLPLIGISWSSTNTFHAHFKSTKLIIWKNIIENKNFQFINLQYGNIDEEINDFKSKTGLNIINDKNVNPSGDLDDFAAQVAAMDLVITISNTTAHMAGALGIPVWNMLPTGPGRLWYWFLSDTKSPWYSSMKLFRHSYKEGWGNVLNEICQLLKYEKELIQQNATNRNKSLL